MNAIIDEFSHIPAKSTRLYMRRRRDKKCVRCGKNVTKGHVLCAKHRAFVTNYTATYYKPKPRTPKLRGSKYDV